MVMERSGLPALVGALLVSLSFDASAVVYELRVQAYCTPGTFCGGGATFAEYELKVRQIVGVVNREWEVTGISFQPNVLQPSADPNYVSLPGCEDPKDPNDPDYEAIRVMWQTQVGSLAPDVITVMVTNGNNQCCSKAPKEPLDLTEPNEVNGLYGVFCNVDNTVDWVGGVWAHELGHYFSLAHTFSGADQVNTFPNLPNYDYDPISDVFDTPPDPGVPEDHDEESDGVPLFHHEFCLASTFPGITAPDSPNPNFCVTQCLQRPNLFAPPIPLVASPSTQNAMSYYAVDGETCAGPVVVLGGTMYPPFTPDGLARIEAARTIVPQRTSLTPLCAPPGNGDFDQDGICAQQDNCDQAPNTDQANADGDAWGAACDGCDNLLGQGADANGDGVCGPDTDDDGCEDTVDQHPGLGESFVSSTSNLGCGSDKTSYRSEGADSDGDGVVDCLDLDDDDDGTCDDAQAEPPGSPGAPPGCAAGPDPCPVLAGGCNFVGEPGVCQPQWAGVCLRGGCVEDLLKMTQLTNPNPFEILFDRFEIVNQKLYVPALAGKTLSETALALTGGFVVDGFSASGGAIAARASSSSTLAPPTLPLRDDRFRLEIWSREPHAFIAEVGEFDADQVTLGAIAQGETIELVPTIDRASGEPRLAVAASWGVAVSPGELTRDRDLDRIPDSSDDCKAVPNESQADRDRDGFGDACDFDLDGDLIVDADDQAYVDGCLGVDVRVYSAMSEPTHGETGPGVIEVVEPDPVALAASVRCQDADLDGDRDVDAVDADAVRSRLGTVPGPSARRAVDRDGDGVRDQDDNCPLVANASQADGGGLGAASAPDGNGDACQCGDVDRDRASTAADARALRDWLARAQPSLVAPELCNVRGAVATPGPGTDPTAVCDVLDAVVLRRALETGAPALEQLCGSL
jgi:hypothetical protein